MNKSGPIVIIDDDLDDQYIFAEAFNELNFENKIIFFADAQLALSYITNTGIEPFLIFSDINMPKLNGWNFEQKFIKTRI